MTILLSAMTIFTVSYNYLTVKKITIFTVRKMTILLSERRLFDCQLTGDSYRRRATTDRQTSRRCRWAGRTRGTPSGCAEMSASR